MIKTPFAMVRNVLLFNMMKMMPAVILGLSLIGTMAEAATPVPGEEQPKVKTFDQALRILMGNGLVARPYYNGVPDPVVRRQVDNRTRMRAMINAKLNSLIVRRLGALAGYTMEEVIDTLENAFKKADAEAGNIGPDGKGVGFQLHINQYLDPGGVPINNGGGAGAGAGGGEFGGGAVGPGGGGGIDPATGLPIGMGEPGGMGGGVAPAIDPTTGLPIGAGGIGAGGIGAGGIGVGGIGVGGIGAGGIPGVGGDDPAEGAFDPTEVKVRGLKKDLSNLTAKQILDIVVMAFDTPIQYIVTDQGIMFLQQKEEYRGTVTRLFQLNLNMRTLQAMGVAVPQLAAPNNGNGQGGGAGGGAGGGEPGGGFGGGADPGGGFGGGEFGGGAGPGGAGGGPAPGAANFKYQPSGNSGGFGSSYRPFSNLNRFAPATGGSPRFNRSTPGYGPSRTRGRQ